MNSATSDALIREGVANDSTELSNVIGPYDSESPALYCEEQARPWPLSHWPGCGSVN